MSEPRFCRHCRAWAPRKRWVITDPDNHRAEQREDPDAHWGWCTPVRDYVSAGDPGPIVTRRDFGCVLFVAKEGAHER